MHNVGVVDPLRFCHQEHPNFLRCLPEAPFNRPTEQDSVVLPYLYSPGSTDPILGFIAISSFAIPRCPQQELKRQSGNHAAFSI
nr:hypothetical protein CFP56_12251 [Quercus suber]